MSKYGQSVKRLDRAEELTETVMGRAFGENAAGVEWMGDVWGMLNQAAGKIGTARDMLQREGGWDHEGDQPEPTTSEAMEQRRPPDFNGATKQEAYEIGWLRAMEYMKGSA